jgi:hypothetical protein
VEGTYDYRACKARIRARSDHTALSSVLSISRLVQLSYFYFPLLAGTTAVAFDSADHFQDSAGRVIDSVLCAIDKSEQ